MSDYDSTDPQSIRNFARQLLNKSLRGRIPSDALQGLGKGGFGNFVQEHYFGYPPNSNAEPDFKEAGVELKTSPLKRIKKWLVSKERLVMNVINYEEEYLYPDFKSSSFWLKNRLLLLMFYIHDNDVTALDRIFKYIDLLDLDSLPAEDLKIITDDWEKIVQKIKDGKAHEISEGDTMYLGACTKGATKESKRRQPFSSEDAMQRAFSLKSKYLNYILKTKLAGVEGEDDAESVVKDVGEYSKEQTFEEMVISKFTPYFWKTEKEIWDMFGVKLSKAKDKSYLLAKAVLWVRKKKIEEFEKAGVILKTITLSKTGTLKESMSFSQIQFKEIVAEKWEESYWYDTLTSKMFFVVFQKNGTGESVLKNVMFWTMPSDDLEVVRVAWEDTKRKVLDWNHEEFVKISDDRIMHVRPKGANAEDLMESVDGRDYGKKCYWLNRGYVVDVILHSQNLSKLVEI